MENEIDKIKLKTEIIAPKKRILKSECKPSIDQSLIVIDAMSRQISGGVLLNGFTVGSKVYFIREIGETGRYEKIHFDVIEVNEKAFTFKLKSNNVDYEPLDIYAITCLDHFDEDDKNWFYMDEVDLYNQDEYF